MQSNDDGASTGTVEWYDPVRGVGAIRPDDEEETCAFHSDALQGTGIDGLTGGERVRFRMSDDGGERKATNLARIRAFDRWENEGGAVGPPRRRPDDPTKPAVP